jgi:hypothetical protein
MSKDMFVCWLWHPCSRTGTSDKPPIGPRGPACKRECFHKVPHDINTCSGVNQIVCGCGECDPGRGWPYFLASGNLCHWVGVEEETIHKED